MSNKRFTFVCGADEFLVVREAQQAWEALTKDIEDEFAKEVIDGAAGVVAEVEAAVDGLIAAAQTMPMFGDRKCVWLKNVTFFGETAAGRTESAKAQVSKLIAALETMNLDQVQILISAFPVDRRRKEFKWLQGNSDFRYTGDGGAEGSMQLLLDALAREGVKIRPEAAHALLEKINGNSRLAVEEANKLVTYMGDEVGEIDLHTVNMLVPTYGEGDFFEATEAFLSLDLQEALAAIRRHFFAGLDIRPLLTSLQNRTRLLIQLRVLMDAGEFGRSVNKAAMEEAASLYARHFGDSTSKSNFNIFTQHPFFLSRLVQTARRLKLRQLIDLQTGLLRAFEDAITRPSEHELIMRETAIRFMGSLGK